MRHGKAGGQHSNPCMNRSRHYLGIDVRHFESPKRIVAGEEFVAAITTEGHRDMPACEAAEEKCRQKRTVPLRLIKEIENLRYHAKSLINPEHIRVVVGL